MNRPAFFAALRKRDSGLFGTSLSQKQVATMDAILDSAEVLRIEQIAYILATAYHEAKMVPVRESLHYTSAAQLSRVWPSRFKTPRDAEPYVRNAKKLAEKVYGDRLGNRPGSGDGFRYRGGGLDQLTGRDNYRALSAVVGLDLVAEPERILEPKIAVESLIHGMTTGRYRGKKLGDFIRAGSVDFVGARAIINADVSRVGPTVAGYARAFLAALEVARERPAPLLLTPQERPVEARPQPTPAPTSPPTARKTGAAKGSIAALVAGAGIVLAAKWAEFTAWVASIFN